MDLLERAQGHRFAARKPTSPAVMMNHR